jgi:hypothetical protein
MGIDLLTIMRVKMGGCGKSKSKMSYLALLIKPSPYRLSPMVYW